RTALGIAPAGARGISGNFATMPKPLHAGNGARNGVMAALLGGKGFTASPIAFEARAGYSNPFGRGLDVSFDPFDDLSRRYDLIEARFDLKGFPCGGLTHTAIEAALDLRGKLGARLSDIKGIHCFVTRNA